MTVISQRLARARLRVLAAIEAHAAGEMDKEQREIAIATYLAVVDEERAAARVPPAPVSSSFDGYRVERLPFGAVKIRTPEGDELRGTREPEEVARALLVHATTARTEQVADEAAQAFAEYLAQSFGGNPIDVPTEAVLSWAQRHQGVASCR